MYTCTAVWHQPLRWHEVNRDFFLMSKNSASHTPDASSHLPTRLSHKRREYKICNNQWASRATAHTTEKGKKERKLSRILIYNLKKKKNPPVNSQTLSKQSGCGATFTVSAGVRGDSPFCGHRCAVVGCFSAAWNLTQPIRTEDLCSGTIFI